MAITTFSYLVPSIQILKEKKFFKKVKKKICSTAFPARNKCMQLTTNLCRHKE